MILCDFGATVTKIDRSFENPIDCLAAGKRVLALNIKHERGQDIVRRLSRVSDVLIDPYRPGVLEKLNLGPDRLLAENPRLIYARLTGFGQNGPLAQRAGHDINYAALSGVLSMLGKSGEPPAAPVNLLADFAGGGLLCAFGICAALLERHRSGKGQVVDNSMSEGCAYIGSWLMRSQTLPIWGNPRGANVLDGGAFYYGTYETQDGKFMSVGALEPQFFKEFIRIIGLSGECEQFDDDDSCRRRIAELFRTKTQDEWSELFENFDACVVPVLDWRTAHNHPHNSARNNFIQTDADEGTVVPAPAPKLSRTPAVSGATRGPLRDFMAQTEEILAEIDVKRGEIVQLGDEGVILFPDRSKL